MTAITLYPPEMRRLQEHGRALLVRPVKPQPSIHTTKVYSRDDWPGAWVFRSEIGPQHDIEYRSIRCPLTPGSIVWGRETWRIIPQRSDYVLEYVASPEVQRRSVHPDTADRASMTGSWRSPVTMPVWASRFPRLLVGDVRCVIASRLLDADYELGIFWAERYGWKHPSPVTWAWAVEVSAEGVTP